MYAFRRKLLPTDLHTKIPDKEPREKPGINTTDQGNTELMGRLEVARSSSVPHSHDDDVDPPAILVAGKNALDEIFKWIKTRTGELLEEVNQRLLAYNRAPSDPAETAYNNAVRDFKKFVNSLNDETPGRAIADEAFSFGPTINAANIQPIKDGDGFYTSVKIIVQWQGGTHSDSTVTHVP